MTDPNPPGRNPAYLGKIHYYMGLFFKTRNLPPFSRYIGPVPSERKSL